MPPLPQEIYGDESMGRKKHGGPLLPFDPAIRSDGEHADHGGFQMWSADGAPYARSTFRAAPDDKESEKDNLMKRRGDTAGRIYDYIETYKQEMIAQGSAHEILPSREAGTFQITDELPDEAVQTMRNAFAANDPSAMSQAMTELEKYDPKHMSFDDRIKFWHKEFTKAWAPEFQKDDKVAKGFVQQSLEPFLPPVFQEMEKDRQALEKYEETKELAMQLKRERQNASGGSAFPMAVDLTDSACSVIQSKSSSMEWETNALMGAHPGVMFGCHCTSTFDTFPFEGIYGEPDSGLSSNGWEVDFALRYPKSKPEIHGHALPEDFVAEVASGKRRPPAALLAIDPGAWGGVAFGGLGPKQEPIPMANFSNAEP